MIKFIRINFLLLIILIFTFATRIIFLDQFPIGLTHDELNYIIAAKSLFWTGNFAPGTAPAVIPTNMSNYTVVIAEVPALLLAPLVGSLHTTLFFSRIVGAILSTLIVLGIFLLAKHLTDNRMIALIASIVATINPWSFLMGRTIFESNFFVAFFLWGFLVLIKNYGWKILYALPLYFLGFFSYTGGQIVFYLFILITLIYHYFNTTNLKRNLKPYLVFLGLMTLVLIFYISVVFHNQTFQSRGGEIYLPSQSNVIKSVNQERLLAVPTPLNNLFVNKITVYLTGFIDKYLNNLSINNLFVKGEFRAAFSYQKHGTFYFIDLLFILIGLSSLFSLNKKRWFLCLIMVAISGITSALSNVEYSYSQRGALMFPFLIILISIGVYYCIIFSKLKLIRNSTILAISIIYVMLFANLLNIYFYRFPVYASDGWFYQDRQLSRYITLAEENYPNSKIVVSTFEPKIIFEEYLFYNNLYSGLQVKDINRTLARQDYEYKRIKFTSDCFINKIKDSQTVWVVDPLLNCQFDKSKALRITRFKDVYENYLILDDKLCSKFPLGSYVSPQAFLNFDVEKQSEQKFCQSWITKL